MGRTEIVAAPPALVFRAHTEPALLPRWLGPQGMTVTVERMELRDGGTWRYAHRDAEGAEYGFHGVFHGPPSAETGIVPSSSTERRATSPLKRSRSRSATAGPW